MLFLVACTGQNGSERSNKETSETIAQDPYKQAIISFDRLRHDFGTIIEGEMVVCYFEYENNGDGALIITSVDVSCGCTTPDWNDQPLSPGEKESLKIIFDTTGRNGVQQKVVTVYSNASNHAVRLTLTANVDNSV